MICTNMSFHFREKEGIVNTSTNCGYIGDLTLEKVHNGSLLTFVNDRQVLNRKTKTINNALQVIRHILYLAADQWIDENGLSWIAHANKIKLLPLHDSRNPHPLSWDEQILLFNQLPQHIRHMATFKVNTGWTQMTIFGI